VVDSSIVLVEERTRDSRAGPGIGVIRVSSAFVGLVIGVELRTSVPNEAGLCTPSIVHLRCWLSCIDFHLLLMCKWVKLVIT
jgi:hypothetical protein